MRDPSRRNVVSWLIVFFLAAVVLAACGASESSPEDGSVPEDGTAESPPAAVEKARETLAAKLGLEAAEVTIESYEEAEWSDSCLGLGGPAESCLAAIHPGWLVMLSTGGEPYEVRTDESGDIVRIKE